MFTMCRRFNHWDLCYLFSFYLIQALNVIGLYFHKNENVVRSSLKLTSVYPIRRDFLCCWVHRNRLKHFYSIVMMNRYVYICAYIRSESGIPPSTLWRILGDAINASVTSNILYCNNGHTTDMMLINPKQEPKMWSIETVFRLLRYHRVK